MSIKSSMPVFYANEQAWELFALINPKVPTPGNSEVYPLKVVINRWMTSACAAALCTSVTMSKPNCITISLARLLFSIQVSSLVQKLDRTPQSHIAKIEMYHFIALCRLNPAQVTAQVHTKSRYYTSSQVYYTSESRFCG